MRTRIEIVPEKVSCAGSTTSLASYSIGTTHAGKRMPGGDDVAGCATTLAASKATAMPDASALIRAIARRPRSEGRRDIEKRRPAGKYVNLSLAARIAFDGVDESNDRSINCLLLSDRSPSRHGAGRGLWLP
jgi:hypothetical protein